MYRNVASYMDFNTWTQKIRLDTWDDDGKPVTYDYDIRPSIHYADSRGTDGVSIYGEKLRKKDFPNTRDRKKWIEANLHLKFYDYQTPEAEFLREMYKNDYRNPDFSGRYQLKKYFLDIEVATEPDFSTPEQALYPINAITIYCNVTKKYHIWTLTDKALDRQRIVDILAEEAVPKSTITLDQLEFYEHNDEKVMLRSFVNWMNANPPDSVVTWNGMSYDIPYIMHRGEKILGNEIMKRISPVGNYYIGSVSDHKGFKEECYVIKGWNQMDYQRLYRDKFTWDSLHSYSLDVVLKHELGAAKLEYTGTMSDFWKDDFDRWVSYNIRDVELMPMLDEKIGLIDRVRSFCNNALVGYDAIYSSIPTIFGGVSLAEYVDGGRLFETPQYERTCPKFDGGYVREPIVGQHHAMSSIDLNSLYPNIIIALNISLETYWGQVIRRDKEFITVKWPNDTERKITREQFKVLLDTKLCMAANGALYYKASVKKGILPKLLERMYEERVEVRAKAAPINKQMEKLRDEGKKDSPEYEKLEREYTLLDNQQYTIKIFLNSVYGVLGTAFSPLYKHVAIPDSVTAQGRDIIIRSADFIEKSYLKMFGADDPTVKSNGVVVYGDTDSIYYSIKPFVRRWFGGNFDWESQEQLDELTCKIDKFVDKINDFCYNSLVKGRMKSDLNRIEFKRECVAKSGIYLAKKRYILHVFDDENKRPVGGKFKYTGVEVKKKELPPVTIKILSDFIEGSIRDEWSPEEIRKAQYAMWDEYKNLTVDEIGYYKSLSTPKEALLDEDDNEYFLTSEKGAQAQARGCIYYNQLTQKLGLRAKYKEIMKGAKYRYAWIKTNNKYGVDVMAYSADGVFPSEFQDFMSIDMSKMFQKQINAPLKKIFEACNWIQIDATDVRVIDIME